VTLTLVLPWFPIVLGVGVGGRLLDRTRGFALGLLCALFWIILVQASAGPDVWRHPWSVAAVVAGALAIVAMGAWAGESHGPASAVPQAEGNDVARSAAVREDDLVLDRVVTVLDQFDDWLERHRNERDPWPRFDEFIRAALYQGCQATHVRPLRLASDGEELVPLREADAPLETQRLSARRGIIGHVVTTGRAYVAGDPGQGELVRRLADSSVDRAAWCFAVKQGTERLGAVVIGELAAPPHRHPQLLPLLERMIARFWSTLLEVTRGRAAVLDDPVSNLYTREAFLRAAEPLLAASYGQCEPVALAIFAVEGLRELNDRGRWEAADELVREFGQTLRRKVRLDDCLGRFDGSRFLVLLRRVDSELASLIVAQTMARLETVCGDQTRWRAAIRVRCGVVGSGIEQPSLRTLLAQALAEIRRARDEDVAVASDLHGFVMKSGAAS